MHFSRLPWLLISLTACPAASPVPDVPLSVPGGAPVLDLRRLPATWTLPASPADEAPSTDAFVLRQIGRSGGSVARRFGARWSAPLPFRVGPESEAVPPAGMIVIADGVDLPWHRTPGAGPGWRIHDQQLLLTTEVPPTEVLVVHPALRRHRDRLDPARAGLPPDDYAAYSLALGPDTREGLLLPQGATASWSVTIPPGGRFEAAIGMVEDHRPESEQPATLALQVRTQDGTEEVLSVSVPATTPAFEAVQADLSAYAGQAVQVQLSTRGAAGDVPFVAHPIIAGSAGGVAPRRVVWIGLDTTRRDRLGLYGYERPTTPMLDAWASRATVFDDANTPAPRTRPSFRSALTGRRPLDAVGAPVLLDLLDAAGFQTAGIVANVHLNRRFGFTRGADRWHLEPTSKADQQVDLALAWLQEQSERDAALFLHIMDPHLPYIPPAEQRRAFVRDPDPDLQPPRFNRSRVLEWQRDGQLDDRRKQHISDLYDAEINFTDVHLGRLFQGLEALPGRTLVVIHSDHGEELWDHGGFEHNHSLMPELHDAVMIVREPGQLAGRRVSAPTMLADLLPTTLDLLGVQPPPTDGQSLTPALRGQPLPERARDLGHLMYGEERWGVRAGEHAYVLWTGSGREQVFDRAAAPTQHHDLMPKVRAERLAALRAALGQVHAADVGPGWRVEVDLATEIVRLELPSPAIGAGVLDPEALRPHRANQAWGEVPPILPDEVARVSLLDEGRTVEIRPGPHGEGTIWVRFAEHTPVAGAVRVLDATATMEAGRPYVLPGLPRLSVSPGTVIVPPADEASRMRELDGGAPEVDAQTAGLLRRLGYMAEDEDSSP